MKAVRRYAWIFFSTSGIALTAIACGNTPYTTAIPGAGGERAGSTAQGGIAGGSREEAGEEEDPGRGGAEAGAPEGVGGSGAGGRTAEMDPEESEAESESKSEEVLCEAGKLNAGLLGHWAFEEGSGARVADGTENGNDGLVVEGPLPDAGEQVEPNWGEGKKGTALKFDGEDDWVRIPASASLNETGDKNAVSVAAWVNIERLNTTENYNFLVMRHRDGSRREQFGLGLFRGLPTSAIAFFYATGPGKVALGKWVHMAMTYDGLTERVYVDGEEAAFLDIGWPVNADTTPVAIGAAISNEEVTEHMAGMIDEVRIYNRKLLPCEVKLLAAE